MEINDEFNEYAEATAKCNEITALILEDFKEFLKFHLNDLTPLLCGFIYHEIAKVAYVACMANGHTMAIENAENGGTSDLEGLLRSYKERFDDSTRQMYEEYLKKEMN